MLDGETQVRLLLKTLQLTPVHQHCRLLRHPKRSISILLPMPHRNILSIHLPKLKPPIPTPHPHSSRHLLSLSLLLSIGFINVFAKTLLSLFLAGFPNSQSRNFMDNQSGIHCPIYKSALTPKSIPSVPKLSGNIPDTTAVPLNLVLGISFAHINACGAPPESPRT
jgi:hypothetical protein